MGSISRLPSIAMGGGSGNGRCALCDFLFSSRRRHTRFDCDWSSDVCSSDLHFDDRMQRMQRQGRVSFYMKSTGEEAVSVGQGMALLPGDMLFPSYRNQALYIVRGRDRKSVV